jgi:outer membrane protein OmpU
MNNLKKLGLSALAGSLVAVSAQAGEIAVSGSANVTYVTGPTGNTSKSLGTDKDVTFSGSGELDNGWTFAVGTLMTDGFDVSSSYTSLTMGSLGTITFGTHTGGASYMYDEETPQVYEQTSDAQQNSANIVGNALDSNGLMYALPAMEMGGATVNMQVEYTPHASDVGANDGGATTYTDGRGSAMGAGITVAYDALKVGVYAAEIENTTPANATAGVLGDAQSDSFEGVWYATYSMGPVSIGYTESYLENGRDDVNAAETANTAKTVRSANGIFESDTMSIAFNVNDNLSISYTETDDTYDAQSDMATNIVDVTQSTEALQVAYSMGGMSIKAYNMETTNPGYDDDAASASKTEIALGLAF